VQDYDRERVSALFRELEFRMLAQRLQEVLGGQPTAANEAMTEVLLAYETVTTEPALDDMVAALRAAGSFAVAGLSSAGDAVHPFPLGLSFATEPGRAWYVPFGHAPRLDDVATQLPRGVVVEAVEPLFEDPALLKTSYGSKYLMHLLDRIGVGYAGNDFDVNIAAFLLGETSSTLNPLVEERLGIDMVHPQTLTGTGRNAVSLAQCEMEKVAEHACQQAEMLLRIRPQLEAQLHERGQWELFAEMEMPLIPALFRMERWGVALDATVLRELSRDMSGDITRSEAEIYALVGHEFNIGSPQQLSDILFKELGLPKSRKTASGYSTDQRALEALRPVTPIIDLLFEYRGLTKLKSTYLDALPGTVAEDGRIHTDFQQTVAATGRLSSNNPNLQNIPVRDDRGRGIRRAFVATGFDDPWFVAADYSQIELRVLAHVTNDPGLISAFLADQDIHRATAATVYAVEPEAVTRQMRDTAKMVNFGIAYGMGEFGLASRTGMSREEADAFIKAYFLNFAGIAEWQKRTLSQTREKGYAETLFGRRRYLPAVHSSNFQVRSAAEREAINMPIQGTAADIIKIAMIRIDEEMRSRDLQSRMLLQVHDELIFECPHEEVEAVKEMAVRVMPASIEMAVPLKVDLKTGKNWGVLEP
jgi:DNA polymerase-1